MKSIVLCERTLVQESEDFKSFKEEKATEGNNVKGEGKKIANGTIDNGKNESPVQNSEKDGITIQNGDRRCSKAFSREEVSENDRNSRLPAAESVGRENSLTDKTDPPERNSLSSVKCEFECPFKSENLENSAAQNGCAHVEDTNVKSAMEFSIENDGTSDTTVQIIESDKSESSQETNCDSVSKTIDPDLDDEGKLTHAESKENVQPLDDIVLDLDENKENEKEEKAVVLDDISESDLLDRHSSSCEIQVGKVETISGTEKESMWAENDFKKSQDSTEKSEEKLAEECQDVSMSNDDSMNAIEGGKEDESHEFAGDETLVSEGEENLEEGMHIEVEESEQTEEGKIEAKGAEKVDNSFSGRGGEENDSGASNKSESTHCRKRQIIENNDEDPSSKKKRLSEDREEEPDQVQLEEENMEESSRCESLSSLDAMNSSSKAGQFSDEAKAHKSTERTLTEENTENKLNASAKNEDSRVEKHGIGETMFSVLEKFRGTLKTLTRSDLEELIIQKLCEVITERSNVGELRQKAQALEQEQERWKTKAQSLSKQMREMEMVMKKYMSEVQRQIKDGDNHVVTPLKVTRSVGLQVSFYSSTNKAPKSHPTQPVPSVPAPNTKNAKGSQSTPTMSPQLSQVTPNARNKTAPLVQKASPPLQKSPVNQQRRPIAPKPDYGSTASTRPVAQQSLLNNSRGTPNQVQAQASRQSYKSAVGSSPQPQQHKQLPPHNQQQQQQSGSKVIDLTEDDDRQTGSSVKPTGSIRVVNHLAQQPKASQNNRFAYLLPPASSPTGTAAGQSRQVLIAPQPNRQIMCSMPPLLFKGGNVVEGGSQPQMLNQSNKVLLPKTLRHPAPLPQRPDNQNTRPSLKLIPPRPALKISKVQTGIVLSWNMSLSPEHAPIASYQLYAYQESDSPPTTSLWKKVGDVKALPLPMACTLTQFMSGHKYHFAVRAVDLHSRIGPFSFPGTIVLV